MKNLKEDQLKLMTELLDFEKLKDFNNVFSLLSIVNKCKLDFYFFKTSSSAFLKTISYSKFISKELLIKNEIEKHSIDRSLMNMFKKKKKEITFYELRENVFIMTAKRKGIDIEDVVGLYLLDSNQNKYILDISVETQDADVPFKINKITNGKIQVFSLIQNNNKKMVKVSTSERSSYIVSRNNIDLTDTYYMISSNESKLRKEFILKDSFYETKSNNKLPVLTLYSYIQERFKIGITSKEIFDKKTKEMYIFHTKNIIRLDRVNDRMKENFHSIFGETIEDNKFLYKAVESDSSAILAKEIHQLNETI